MIRRAVYNTFRLLATAEVRRLQVASENPRAAQLERLRSILQLAQNSAFGKEHGLAATMTYADFSRSTPIVDYERLRPYVDRIAAGERNVLTECNPFMFATTSGTTGDQKLIPVNRPYIKEFRRASTCTYYNLFRMYPAMSRGCSLSVFSPAVEGHTSGGLPFGAISGALFQKEPYAMKRYVAPIPYEVFTIKDYEAKYYCILRAALSQPIMALYTLNPSTLVLLSRRLKVYGSQLVRDVYDGTLSVPGEVPQNIRKILAGRIMPDKSLARRLQALIDREECVPHRVWPELQLVSCWTKAAASFYLADFPEYFGSVPVHDITYGASEGRGTIFMGPDQQMLAIRSHFYEFVPEEEINSANPTVLLSDELSEGSNYFILFTTSAGLFRYHINDVVKVTGFYNKAPLIEFQYKGGNTYSFTGEKITELQVTEAMKQLLSEDGLGIRYFSLVPEFRPQPHYRLWIEAIEGSSLDCERLAILARRFDQQLCHLNVEYKSKRESFRLDPVTVEQLQAGVYEKCRKWLVAAGIPDSQVKLSHLNPKPEIASFLQQHLCLPAPPNNPSSPVHDSAWKVR